MKGGKKEAYWFSTRINFDSGKGAMVRIDSVILVKSKTM